MKDYPFIKFTIFFVIGILIQRVYQPDVLLLISAMLTLLLIIIFIKILLKKYQKNLISKVILYCIFILSGLLLAVTNHTEINSPLIKYQKEKNSELFATVKKVELEKNFEIVFTALSDSVKINNKKIISNNLVICKFRGDSLQRKNLYEKILPGNKIYLTGTFQQGRGKRNPGEFNYDEYLKSKKIVGIFVSYNSDSISITNNESNFFSISLFKMRVTIDELIQKLHRPETAALLRGLLLADRSEIDFETKSAFINSGVIHTLAVSGLHVGYVLIIVIFLFGRLNIYLRTLFIMLALLFFMFLTGIPPSVFRATLMAMILLLAFLFNRGTNIINSISVAAAIILIFNPSEIYNPGFQLSFAAVLSIGLLFPKIRKTIDNLHLKRKWVEYILLFIGVSLSVQIGTMPFTLAYFSKLSLVSLFSNLLVIPTIGVIIGNAFITLFVGIFSFPIASIFASANDLFAGLMFSFIKFAGGLDFAFLWIRNYSLYDSIVYYLLIFFLLFSFSKIQNNWIKFIVIVSCSILILIYSNFDNINYLKKNNLSVMMIDVGQGDSFLIKFPNGKTALIDAGEANPFFDNGERTIIPLLDYFGIDKLDYGFVSHLDLDHYGGFISLIHENRIKEIYRPLPDSSLKSARFEKYLEQKNIQTNYYRKSVIDIGNAKIYIFNNPFEKSFDLAGNDKSGVLKVVYGKTSFLFLGDCEYPAENYLMANYGKILDSDVLKVGHHGSKTSSSKAFLNLVSPKISLVSAGFKNKFNHPSQEVLNSLIQINSAIYRTDILGAVILQSDGEEINKINWN